MSSKPESDRDTGAVSSLLTASLFLACSLAAFLPIQVYLANSAEYSSPLGTVVRAGACAAAAIFVVLALFGLLLPHRVRIWWAAALVGLALAVYLQANFFVWNYGLLDGRDLQWTRNAGKTGLEVGVETAILLLCLVFRRTAVRHGALIATLLLAAGGGVTAARIFTQEPPPSSHFYSIDESRLVTFSPKHDIVVVLLDEFQSNILGNLLAASPVIQKRFDGFTYYPNAVSGFAKTYGSVPNILTGTFYDNRKTVREYLRHAYADSFLVDLKKAGYRVELYPWNVRVLHVDPSIASNVVARFPSALFPDELLPLFDVSLFRHVPHPLKKRVVGDGRWLVSRIVNSERTRPSDGAPIARNALSDSARPRDLNFLNLLDRSTVTSDPTPVFKFYHLQGPHEPLWLDGDLQVHRLPSDRSGYLAQARASLRVAGALIAEIQRLGLSDRTDLFVISDHGAGEYGIPPPGDNDTPAAASSFVRSSGLPLVLFRRAGATGPLKTSQAPVALVDIGATVAQLTGIPAPRLGKSLLAPSTDPQRLRRYYHYTFEGWDQHYLPNLQEFEVRGNSWSPGSWHPTGVILIPAGDSSAQDAGAPAVAGPTVLADGPELIASKGQPATAFLGPGWSGPEAHFTWSDHKAATLTIPVSGPPGARTLLLRVRPWLLPGRLDRQRVKVTLNGTPAGLFVLEKSETLRIDVPADVFASHQLTVDLVLPDAASPLVDFQQSADARILGVAFYGVQLQPGASADVAPSLRVDGPELRFGAGQPGTTFLGSGWSRPEDHYTWSDQKRATLQIPVSGPPVESVLLLHVRPLLLPGRLDQQRVDIALNGAPAGSFVLTGSDTLRIKVPAAACAAGRLAVDLSLPDAASPQLDYHQSADARTLGVALFGVSLNSAAP